MFQDAESHAFPDLGTWLGIAVNLRAAYLESAAMAHQLCKPKGGRRKKAPTHETISRLKANKIKLHNYGAVHAI